MLELHQFEASHYCEKVRLVLDYKRLSYKTIEISPGLGQVELYRMSGQRQVPVLKDGDEIIPDSTAIARYLDAKCQTDRLFQPMQSKRACAYLWKPGLPNPLG